MRRHVLVSFFFVLAVAACGGGDEEGGGSVSSPCDLADAAMVQSVFGGTVSEGEEGVARNCTFEIEGGPVVSVDVFWFGPASGWDGTRDGYVDNRDGVTDVSGIGDEAFHPNDSGPIEIVAHAGGEIFAITLFNAFLEPEPEAPAQVSELAQAIADNLG